ncbi:bifunctional tRNA (5-methylaminomethyl-2-thiouridine)(34)-methyltransferase MnmD/FAD-dependent 5-carboxymethylaminomethyl-2-thiouridine(34) oxidoreductase MnmC [Thalassomonas viridans]|uniref:bifunctional tRNA (5-methylaminomethyl-2-thiouridine)(34)-methyltransferase MnmD/FAD-dependent 5-carboxymethylaminomethyl-2-thiouridine(34) oxidoreductase MnmC n=1 Tax=Thalassomonas viridans TaxID=137584 RepID=UPI0005CE75F9|nr:bifunctional tRNA (5-methylaminomethyl-2-thiouridine)(34)-methyltransferase MnmD/FAD-dependent 5-carboxymethylaminomethyl-2-thiouridine(34) oxidoreductase MnmC [Thalassomonas viridans]
MNKDNQISFGPDGAPFSEQFQDIYFDSNSGCQQSSAVFIQGNDIFNRLVQGQTPLTIAETGFGSGLNFLLTLQVYQKAQQERGKKPLLPLTFISVEKYPLTKEQLKKSLAILPELAEYTRSLVEQYPEKCEQMWQGKFLDGQVTLQLYFDDAASAFSGLKSKKSGLIDAWYLDGFSPRKNPDMWHPPLFEQIARLSKEQASVATFTVAGLVRRQLAEIGFRLEKKATGGKKKQMLTGIFQQGKNSGKGYRLRPGISKPHQVGIIGGGIASACAAYALTRLGVKVNLYCRDSAVAQGASSNAIGALYPLLHQQADDISLFYQQAFNRARALYRQVSDEGHEFPHQWCGLLEVSYKESLQKRQQVFEQLKSWPKTLIHGVDAEKANQLAGLDVGFGGLFMPGAGWIAPGELVKTLFDAAQATNRLKIKTDINIDRISQNEDLSWQLHSGQNSFHEKVLIICGGAESIKLNISDQLPLSSVRGQVSSMPSNQNIGELNTVLCHKGYLTPQHNNQHCIGATFEKNSFDTDARAEDDAYNLNMLDTCLPGLSPWSAEDVAASKARLRCMTPDHLPVVGPMPDIEAHKTLYAHLSKDKNWRYNQAAPVIDNLYLMTGLGARGLCSAPLLADILAADICGTPYPVDTQMLFNLAPNRFVIRDLIKGKVKDKS